MTTLETMTPEHEDNLPLNVAFSAVTGEYVLPGRAAELCRQAVLEHCQGQDNLATQDLSGIRSSGDFTILSIPTARTINVGLDTLHERQYQAYGADDPRTKAIYDLSLRLALAIFEHDMTIGQDKMAEIRQRHGFREWFSRLLPCLVRDGHIL